MVNAGPAAALVTAVVNAASFTTPLAPGTIGTIAGVNLAGGTALEAKTPWPTTLAGVRVQLDGRDLPLLYASDRQINFYIPADFAIPVNAHLSESTLAVLPPGGAAASTTVDMAQLSPGIFPEGGTGFGAILRAGTAETTSGHPVKAGDYVEIYCTGLGPTLVAGGYEVTAYKPVVYIGGIASVVQYSGTTGIPGLYQVNAQVPFGVASGPQPLVILLGSASSNEVQIGIR